VFQRTFSTNIGRTTCATRVHTFSYFIWCFIKMLETYNDDG